MAILTKYMDNLEAERFITLIQRDKMDYTEWRQGLFAGLSGREISKAAMQFIKSEGKEN
jgi:hypothetical protein